MASYTGSHPQGNFIQKIMPTIEAVVDDLMLPTGGVVSVADLGCTLGPNTIANVSAIIDRMKTKYEPDEMGCTLVPHTITSDAAIMDTMKKKFVPGKMPEFRAYFQDLAGTDINTLSRRLSKKDNFQEFTTTDFNTLFRRLSKKANLQDFAGKELNTFFRRFGKEEKAEDDARAYSTLSIPGSFYGYQSLLPPSSIHFAISAFQLHRLSQVPREILDEKSRAYNTELHNATFSTLKAYADQAEEDLDSFLASRAQEMVHGGYMILIFGIRDKYCPSENGKFSQLQERMWELLFSNGLVEHDTKVTYRRMIYYRTLDEVTRVLRFRKEFRVEQIEVHPSLLESYGASDANNNIVESGVNLLKAHFGNENTELFLNESKRAPNIAVIVLKRK